MVSYKHEQKEELIHRTFDTQNAVLQKDVSPQMELFFFNHNRILEFLLPFEHVNNSV